MKNIIIVEGTTDKKLVEAYISYLKRAFSPTYLVIDTIEAKGQDGIYNILNSLKIPINKDDTKNIGLIIDADDDGMTAKIQNKINPAIAKAFGVQNLIKSANECYSFEHEGNTVHIFCHLFHIDGRGELEDILREIRQDQHTKSAICLTRFVDCIEGFNEAYPQKQYNKNVIYFYAYDCLKKAGLPPDDIKRTLKNNEYYMPEYWNFEHHCLKELRQFLALFDDLR